jgi:uncharacterized protein
MKTRDFDVDRLDVEALAKEGGQLEGTWPISALERLSQSVFSEAAGTAGEESSLVHWGVQGEQRKVAGSAPQIWLYVNAHTSALLQCQRCLHSMRVPISIERAYLFVHGESTAAKMDLEGDDDVLAVTKALNARELIEDELLLALPLVPRHEICPEPLRMSAEAAPIEADAVPHPFAALATLKRGRQAN